MRFWGQLLIGDERPKLVDERGNVFDDIVDETGNVFDERDHIVDERGNIVDERGNIVGRRGNLLDELRNKPAHLRGALLSIKRRTERYESLTGMSVSADMNVSAGGEDN